MLCLGWLGTSKQRFSNWEFTHLATIWFCHQFPLWRSSFWFLGRLWALAPCPAHSSCWSLALLFANCSMYCAYIHLMVSFPRILKQTTLALQAPKCSLGVLQENQFDVVLGRLF
ncbi:hypothetical protein M758_1G318300 [Ceratodon purpureus]|nr:hypothetical protein M758_1G318300 [Ceratodon purpureus]